MSKNKNTRPVAVSARQPVWLWIALAVVSVALVGGFVWLQQQNSTATTNPSPLEISVAEVAAKREAGAFLLDVRQPEEWNQFHIPGSTLIPLAELAANVDKMPRDREIIVVCRSGNRSAQGRDILRNEGFTRVTSMAGGVTQWQSAGYPTVSGP